MRVPVGEKIATQVLRQMWAEPPDVSTPKQGLIRIKPKDKALHVVELSNSYPVHVGLQTYIFKGPPYTTVVYVGHPLVWEEEVAKKRCLARQLAQGKASPETPATKRLQGLALSAWKKIFCAVRYSRLDDILTVRRHLLYLEPKADKVQEVTGRISPDVTFVALYSETHSEVLTLRISNPKALTPDFRLPRLRPEMRDAIRRWLDNVYSRRASARISRRAAAQAWAEAVGPESERDTTGTGFFLVSPCKE